MKLYDNPFSPFARKVRMVLEHKGLACESVDGLRPEGRGELAALNPRVEVPVLVDGGVVVVNSADIVAYLDHRFPSAPVLPADPALRAEARAWERLSDSFLDAITHDVSLWRWPVFERSDAPPPGLLEAAARDLETVYAHLEAHLRDREFLCGALSSAEFALFPHLSAVRTLDVPFSPERHPSLFAWYRRLRRLPVFAADLERVRNGLVEGGGGPKLERVVWRGDRIEWLLANGFHEWFLAEIRAGRVGWPRA